MSTCVSCSRKFAAPYSATNTHLCRTCRSSVANSSMVAPTTSPTITKSPMSSQKSSLLTSTPKMAKSAGGSGGKQGSGSGGIGSGRNLVPMRCKVCSSSFRYRRCLFRHLRENHPGIFSNKDVCTCSYNIHVCTVDCIKCLCVYLCVQNSCFNLKLVVELCINLNCTCILAGVIHVHVHVLHLNTERCTV